MACSACSDPGMPGIGFAELYGHMCVALQYKFRAWIVVTLQSMHIANQVFHTLAHPYLLGLLMLLFVA